MGDDPPSAMSMPAPSSGKARVHRVLMNVDASGAEWPWALESSRALCARGVTVTLATLGAPLTPAQWAEVHEVPGLHVEQGIWRAESSPGAWDDVAAAGAWLLELEARVLPDAVHLHGYCHGALPWRRRPLVVATTCPRARAEREPRYHAEVTRGLRAAGLVVAPSQVLLESLRELAGPLSATHVVPPARRPEDFPPVPLREPFLLSTGAPWDEDANLQVLEAVAPRLHWPLFVLGPLEHPAGGRVRSRALSLLGELSAGERGERLGRASLFVLPAREAVSGLAALEAALAGCALVLADVPTLREMWEGAAVFVPAEDVEAWTCTLDGLIAQPVARARLSTLARTRALRFAPERLADAYLALYLRVGESAPRTPPSQPQLARVLTGARGGRSQMR